MLRNTEFRNVFIHLDLTPFQQEAFREQRRILKERRDDGQDVIMYRGEVKLRSDLLV